MKKTSVVAENCRERLLAKRAELLAGFGARQPAQNDSGHVADDDQAPLLHEQFVSFQMQSLDRQILQQIDAALDRLDTGEYGVCLECGEAISPKRLAAIPWARYCIECQERLGIVPERVDERAA